ncbi:hypothetical protein IAD21_00728 [Abditibacteriota bacterium]|nr:hypothetical protein IAD21_00728 [Abditibacteriota bacterium]
MARKTEAKIEAEIQEHLFDLKAVIQGKIKRDTQIYLSLLDSPETVNGMSRYDPLVTSSPIGNWEQNNSTTPVSSNTFTTFSKAFKELRNRVLVLGAPGAGKTTTLLQFADQAIDARVHATSYPIPLWFSLHQWKFHEHLLQWMQAQYQDLFSVFGPEAPPLLYIFDGLDELGEKIPDVPFVPRRLRDINARQYVLGIIAEELRAAQIVLSSRENDYKQIGEKAKLRGAVTLQPLSNSQIESYLQDRNQISLWNNLLNDDNDNLLELARTPLLLALLSVSFVETNLQTHTNPEDESWTASRIFNLYIQRRLQHETQVKTLPFDEETTRQYLNQIAVFMWRYPQSPSISLTLNAVKPLIGTQWAEFISFAQDMHFLSKSSSKQIEFIHLKFRDYCVISALEKALENNDSSMGRVAASALGRIGDPSAIPILEKALTGNNLHRDVREAAAFALGRIGDPSAIPTLEKALRDETLYHDVRHTAASALGRIDDSNTISALQRVLTDKNLHYGIREATIYVLGEIGDASAIAVLGKALTDENLYPGIREAAATTLKKIGTVQALPALERALRDENLHSNIRHTATSALGRIGDAKAITILGKALTDKNLDRDVREAAASALGRIKDPSAIPILEKALRDETIHSDVRHTAASALGRIGDPSAIPILEKALTGNNLHRDVREAAAFALGRIGDPSAIPTLEKALRDETLHHGIREATASALGRIKAPSAIIALEKALADETLYRGIRETAAFALGEIGDASAIAVLGRALTDKSLYRDVREAAAFALGEIGDASAIPMLEKALTDKNLYHDVREAAAFALGEIGDASAIPALAKALRDEDSDIRQGAAFALEKLQVLV